MDSVYQKKIDQRKLAYKPTKRTSSQQSQLLQMQTLDVIWVDLLSPNRLHVSDLSCVANGSTQTKTCDPYPGYLGAELLTTEVKIF